MSNFDAAVKYVLENEGGLVNNPKDPGGITNFGISIRFLMENCSIFCEKKDYGIEVSIPGHMKEKAILFIRNMTKDQATEIYHEYFWDDKLDKLDKNLAVYIFDMIINHGKNQAIKIVQRSSWGRDIYYRGRVHDDGIFGPETLSCLNSAFWSCSDIANNIPIIFSSLRAERAGFYRTLAASNPDQYKWALEGWLNRAYKEIM